MVCAVCNWELISDLLRRTLLELTANSGTANLVEGGAGHHINSMPLALVCLMFPCYLFRQFYFFWVGPLDFVKHWAPAYFFGSRWWEWGLSSAAGALRFCENLQRSAMTCGTQLLPMWVASCIIMSIVAHFLAHGLAIVRRLSWQMFESNVHRCKSYHICQLLSMFWTLSYGSHIFVSLFLPVVAIRRLLPLTVSCAPSTSPLQLGNEPCNGGTEQGPAQTLGSIRQPWSS